MATAALASAAALAAASPAAADYRDPTNPFVGRQLYAGCASGHTVAKNARRFSAWWHVWDALRHHRTRDAALLLKIARVPQVAWFAGIERPERAVRMLERFLADVDHPRWGGAMCDTRLDYPLSTWRAGPVPADQRDPYVGSYPVIAIRGFKHDRCRGWDGGPWNDPRPGGPYRRLIDGFAHELGVGYFPNRAPTWGTRLADWYAYRYWDGRRFPNGHWAPVQRSLAVILEPDALGLMGRISGCLSARGRSNQLTLLSYAARTLSAIPGVSVYIDAGSAIWLRPGEAVRLLRAAGVRYARGFALNSTHFDWTSRERSYGDRLARILNRHYVVNTAENANGPLPKRQWGRVGAIATNCNPRNAGLGTPPTTHTGSAWADAFLWISRPGLSSNRYNRCGRGPTENVWWDVHAFELARQASFSSPPWPTPVL